MTGTDMRRLWPQVLEVINQSSKTIWAMLEGSQVVESGDGTVTLAVAPSLARRLAEERNTSTIGAAITGLIGGTWRVTVTPGESKSARPAAPAGRSPSVSAAAPPPEPDPRDDEDYEPASGAAAAPRVDAEAEAIKLITTKFDARPIDSP